jgi:hypothetical protein
MNRRLHRLGAAKAIRHCLELVSTKYPRPGFAKKQPNSRNPTIVDAEWWFAAALSACVPLCPALKIQGSALFTHRTLNGCARSATLTTTKLLLTCGNRLTNARLSESGWAKTKGEGRWWHFLWMCHGGRANSRRGASDSSWKSRMCVDNTGLCAPSASALLFGARRFSPAPPPPPTSPFATQ